MSNTQQRRDAAAILAVIVIVSGAFMLFGGRPDKTLIGPDVRLTRVVKGAEATDAAYVTVPYTREAEFPYMNIAIDFNGDGKFAAYITAAGASQEEWVVRDMRALVIEAGNAFSFTLHDTDAFGRKDISLRVRLSEKPLGETEWYGELRGGAGNELTVAEIGIDDYTTRIAPVSPQGTGAGAAGDAVRETANAPGTPAVKGWLNTKLSASTKPWLTDTTAAPSGLGTGEAAAIGAVSPSDAVPAGFDFEVFQEGVPDVPQGINECVPTSVSNAIHSLADRYGFTDKIPETQLETIEELKKDFKWTRADGVYVEPDFMTGKVAFTQRHGLPIVTHQVGTKFDPDVANKVAAELAKGQAVEIVIGYYNLNASNEWVRNGGHMMSAVGAFGMGGKNYLGLHDPASPDTGRLDIYPIERSRIYNYRYRGNSSVFIEYAIAESPTEEWVKTHPPRVAIRTGGAVGESQNFQDVWMVDMINIGNGWYPTVQFHKFTGPECDRAEHWHANAGTAHGLRLSDEEYFETNPQRILARNAPLVSWTDPGNCGAGKSAVVQRANVMVSMDEAGAIAGQLLTQ